MRSVMCISQIMLSEEKLLKALRNLCDLFERSSNEANTEEKMEAYNSGHQQCKVIIAYVENKQISSATNAWKALEYFANDSIGGTESFLKKYQPIRQSIVNSGF